MTAQIDEVFDDLLARRWSCRAFKSDPVPRYVIEAVLKTAQRSASWNNVQPWQVTLTSGAATQRLREMMVKRATASKQDPPHIDWPAAYEGVYKDRRRACGFQLYEAVGIERGDKPAYMRQSLRNFQVFDAPHVALITTEEVLGAYGLLDCGSFLTNFMNAATSHGIATIAQAALAMHSDQIHRMFNMPANRRFVCGIAFGYADEEHPINGYRVPRAPLDEVVTWVDD